MTFLRDGISYMRAQFPKQALINFGQERGEQHRCDICALHTSFEEKPQQKQVSNDPSNFHLVFNPEKLMMYHTTCPSQERDLSLVAIVCSSSGLLCNRLRVVKKRIKLLGKNSTFSCLLPWIKAQMFNPHAV